MSETLTEKQVWEKVNGVKCFACDTVIKAPGDIIDFPIKSEDDVEDVYDLLDDLGEECCDSPHFVAAIQSETPVFGHTIDEDYKLPAHPGNQFRGASDKDMWTYEVNEDLFDVLREADIVDG